MDFLLPCPNLSGKSRHISVPSGIYFYETTGEETQMVTTGKEIIPAMAHRLALEGRNQLSVSGVTEAVSFDEALAVLETAQGTLIIRGANLHVEQLNLEAGEVRLSGQVDSLTYEESAKTQGSFLQRLFR
jgi:sporulation protein YabP